MSETRTSDLPTPERPPSALPESRRAVLPPARRRALEAAVTWSVIAEPTDPTARELVAALGPEDALDLARRGTVADAARHLPTRSTAVDPGDRTTRGEPRARARSGLERWRRRLDRFDPVDTLTRAAHLGMHVMLPGDPDWPRALLDLGEGMPHCLWLLGNAPLSAVCEEVPTLAIVGSRASTAYGEDCAVSLAAGVAAHGATVISGGAYGIDAAAHRGALAAEDGATIAVLAGGLDALYPRGNTRLLETIRDRYCLISEAPPGTAPTRWRFLARNRLIAALGQATVVVEASWRSGALSTARHADDLSRPVGAVPGPVTSAASAGCHRILRDRGGVLVTDAAEVLELLPGRTVHLGLDEEQDRLDLLGPADRRVLDAVPPRSAITLERLLDESALPETAVRAALGRLDLLGHIDRLGDGTRIRRHRG